MNKQNTLAQWIKSAKCGIFVIILSFYFVRDLTMTRASLNYVGLWQSLVAEAALGREERGGDRPTETDTNQIIVWHNREFWLVCTGLAWPLRLRSLIGTLASRMSQAHKCSLRCSGDAYGEDSGDQFSRQRDLVSSEESNRESVKNDGGPPQIQLAWNIFPGVIQKLLWPWLLVQLGRDVRHWKCLEFGRISVVNCRSRSLEEPKKSFNFFLS